MKIYMIGQKGIPALAGGVERHVEELAPRLVQAGHEVFVYCRKHYTPSNLKEFNGVKLLHLPTIKTKHLDAIIHTFIATLDVLFRDADIIHYHAIGPSSLLWIPKLLKRKAKVIATFHCQDYHHQKWGLIARTYLRVGEQVACTIPHKTIAVSKTLQEYARSAYQCNAHYIPNGTALFEKCEPKIIKQWGLEKDNYILAVGRLVRHKGFHHLIKAYQGLKTDKKLVIVGGSAYTDDYVEYLKKLAAGNENVIFTDSQKGQVLAELFSNAYLFVQPSEAEGLSIATLEAFSYGRTVLASDIPENKEVVENVGFVFKNKDIDDLRNKLEFLLANHQEVKESGTLGREHVALNYDWNKITQDTTNLYTDLLPKSKAAVAVATS